MSLQDRITALYEGVEDDPDYLTAAFVIDITEEICRRMDEAGLTQREVARRLGTSQAYIAKVLNNNPNMTVRSLIALADAVGLKLDGVRLVDKKTGWLYAETGSRQLARWSGASYLAGNTKTAVFSDADYTTVEPLPVEREYPDERIADAA
ncbi:MAG TPA: helix-turn-helix transcriptional regulator [Armatimonadota bacterium]|nr:helix-turn-helix transcriptional regulator [Armatimonadota bacterium]